MIVYLLIACVGLSSTGNCVALVEERFVTPKECVERAVDIAKFGKEEGVNTHSICLPEFIKV